MGALAVVELMQAGLKGMMVWQEYQADLLALQQKRFSEGKLLTMADVQPLVDKVHADLGTHKAAIDAAMAAYNAS